MLQRDRNGAFARRSSVVKQGEENMSRHSRFAALAIFAAVIASSGAYARTIQNNANPLAGAHNSVSDMDIRKQCYEEARQRWPSTSQDMQTNRDFAYRTCAFDHGVRNP
jgi:hypothetical protein